MSNTKTKQAEAKASRKPREKVDPNETPRARFQRIGGKRAKTALAKIKLLGNINNTRAYDYTAADVDKIEKALTDRVASVIAAMRAGLEKGPAAADAETFSL